MEYLDFNAIGQAVPFRNLLDWLNIPYIHKNGELKGEGFIVNIAKNLYFNPLGDDKGSVVNFVSAVKAISLRDSASFLKKEFLIQPKPKTLPDYDLDYHSYLEESGISKDLASEFQVGYCKKGIMSGKIAIRIDDKDGHKVAYIGKNLKGKNDYFFPKGYKQDYIYNLHRVSTDYCILAVSPFDVLYLYPNFPYVVGLVSFSMSDRQEKLLSRFKRILLLHPKPANILPRLAHSAFVKAPNINSVRELKEEDIKSFF